jgi:hypothetical protein
MPKKPQANKQRSAKAPAPAKRLKPGELDGLVLTYMREHAADGPLSATTVARGIGRSSGAVANCLGRLVNAKQARQARRKPRSYDLKVAK